jgi:protoporphyrinogen oxidase
MSLEKELEDEMSGKEIAVVGVGASGLGAAFRLPLTTRAVEPTLAAVSQQHG